jgi:tetratricopeptide (TPR) repeat protein
MTRKALEPYVRQEDDTVKAFYRIKTPFYDESPERIKGTVRVLKRITGLSPTTVIFPHEIQPLQEAAGAFVEAIETCFGTRLGYTEEDLVRIDRTIDRFLLDPILDPIAKTYHKRLDENEDYDLLATQVHAPRETLFYYCFGAYYGELMVKLRRAAWHLYPPLSVIQCFPDIAMKRTVQCAFPFSHVVKKMCRPNGDRLDEKAHALVGARCQPPFALAASLADLERIWEDMLGPVSVKALNLAEGKSPERALDLLTAELDRSDGNCHILVEASQVAYGLGDMDLVYRLCERALVLAPTAFNHHNFAVALSHVPERRSEAISHANRAIKNDPAYSRARITLAALYLEEKDVEGAIAQLRRVVENEIDDNLREEAEQLLSGIEQRVEGSGEPKSSSGGS